MEEGRNSEKIRELIKVYEEAGYRDYFQHLWRPPFPEIRPDREKWTAEELVIQWAYSNGWERGRRLSNNNPTTC